jgi:hypothetical protein
LSALWEQVRAGEFHAARKHVAEHLYYGDSRAAVVVSLTPIVVAAYTDELDCVVLLEFPDELTQEEQLSVGSRLLCANYYTPRTPAIPLVADLSDGPSSYRRHANFSPYIVEFLSDDTERIDQRKAEISEAEWRRAFTLGMEALTRGARPRDGRPLSCHAPAQK